MRIDREAVVGRHRVEVDAIDPGAALSVGNGELCLTVDVTGLQTFPDHYPVVDPAGGPAGTLLGLQSQWGWHSTPRPAEADLERYRRPYATPRGDVRYVDSQAQNGSDDTALDEGSRWLRANPHRLDLGRIALVGLDAGTGATRELEPEELGDVQQVLDLWTGTIESRFTVDGRRLAVTTACHPEDDAVAVRISADDGDALPVAVRLTFPYGSQSWSNAADWTAPDRHATALEPVDDGAVVRRRFDGADEPTYSVRVTSDGSVAAGGPHEVLVRPGGAGLDLVVALGPGVAALPSRNAAEVLTAARAHWPAFWRSGAALDLSGSTDPRAAELERRAVLSQYLTAIQCAGSLPPQETGLTCNSWRGRFHLEMHWWHGAHFPMWGRPGLLERSMEWYRRILPQAQETARIQGYDGARWPKQVGPDGRESPSDIGPFLLWQQPHVIHLAELLRRAGSPDVVERYGPLVEQTARFMADVVEPTPDGFALGPPLIPAQESYAAMRERVTNPPFELAYWSWALDVAQQWRRAEGRPPEPRWDEVAEGMVRPLVRDGVYEAIGVPPFTVRTDHPSMVYGLGVVPATSVLDPETVRRTLDGVLADWDWPSTWGWDYPALAMTATRLGAPTTAVDALMLPVAKNEHLPNGHNRQTDHLPLYLPGNGGLLAALALMVGGWEGSRPCPGFPDDGTWVVRHEGFVPAP